MNKKELLELEEILVALDESDDKIEYLEYLYRWSLKLYREQGKKKLSTEEFRDDL